MSAPRKQIHDSKRTISKYWCFCFLLLCIAPWEIFKVRLVSQIFHRRLRFGMHWLNAKLQQMWLSWLRQDPLDHDLSFWSFLSFLHHGIEEVERHLLWKFYKTIRMKSWSNVPPNWLACIGFLYKVVHKIGHLRKFNRSSEIEFTFLTAWTTSMKFGTLVQQAPGYKTVASDVLIFAQWLSYGLSKSKKRDKVVPQLWKIITKSPGKN